MPPGLLEDGILYVSISGSPLTGSGKSFTPLSRTHWANRRLADCSLGVRFELNAPGGLRALHASMAFSHTSLVTSTPKFVSPFGSGSGKWGTPFARMHSANFTAFSCLVSFLSAPLPVSVLPTVAVLPAVPVSEAAFEPQPALISATVARAASGHSLVMAASLDRASGRRTWAGNRDRRLRAQLVVPGLVAVDRAQPVAGAVLGQPRGGGGGPDVDRVPGHVGRRVGGGHPAGGFRFRAVLRDRLTEELLLVLRGAPAAVDDELDAVVRGIRRGLAQGTEQSRIELGHTRDPVVEDRRAVGDGAAGLAERAAVLAAKGVTRRGGRRGRGRRRVVARTATIARGDRGPRQSR